MGYGDVNMSALEEYIGFYNARYCKQFDLSKIKRTEPFTVSSDYGWKFYPLEESKEVFYRITNVNADWTSQAQYKHEHEAQAEADKLAAAHKSTYYVMKTIIKVEPVTTKVTRL